MVTPKEIDRDQADRLHDLLLIKKYNKDTENMTLDMAISRAKATMTKEAIVWVKKQVDELGGEKMTKLEKDTIIDAILIFYDMAGDDREKFLEAVEKFRNEGVSLKILQKKDN